MFDGIVDRAYFLDPPEILYHYTSWPGASGILSSQRFWSTAQNCTNDPAELASADSVIVEIATKLRTKAKGTVAITLDRFLATYSELKVSELLTVCLACFSIARDDAGQWMEYGNNGRGLCLGVRVLKEAGPVGAKSAIVKVDYDESSWRETIARNFREILHFLRRLPRGSVSNETINQALNGLYRIATIASISAKQSKWAKEREFRHVTLVVGKDRDNLNERLSKGRTIKYFPVSVRSERKKIALSEIIVGPNQNLDEARLALESMLVKNGYQPGSSEYPDIVSSSITPWSTTF